MISLGSMVARKCAVLARLAGLEVKELTAFPEQSMMPKELESVSRGNDFSALLHEFDDQIEGVKK
jgi:homoserine dehydrogenase